MALARRTGGCGCGAVRFEVAGPLGPARYCHCTRCQRRTGTAASVSAIVRPGSITVTQGAEHLGGWTREGGREAVFCIVCGSALFIRHPETGEFAGVRLGAIDGDPGVRPTARQFVAYAAPWEPIPDDGLARHHERMPRVRLAT
jgi:hypothetical protein